MVWSANRRSPEIEERLITPGGMNALKPINILFKSQPVNYDPRFLWICHPAPPASVHWLLPVLRYLESHFPAYRTPPNICRARQPQGK